jgi:outer membrane lipoprotein-sorting protein
MRRNAICLFVSIAALACGVARASDADAAWEALAKRVAELERYSVKVAVSIFETQGSKPANLMTVTAARDGKRYHYRNGPVEIVWATNRTVVVNHSARRIIVRPPQGTGATPAAIVAATTHGTDSSASSSRARHSADEKGILIVDHDKGPVQRIEVRVDQATGLPVQAVVTYRRGPRLPARVAMTYDWSTGPSCQCPAFDDGHLLRWTGDNAEPHSSLPNYHVVRLDRQ